MAKNDNLLMVLHLFATHRNVTVQMISETCEVSERTAFRYLTSLEESGYPLSRGEKHGGCSLLTKTGCFTHLSPPELSVVYLGLEILEPTLSPIHAETFRRVRTKLAPYMTKEVQNQLAHTINSLGQETEDPQMREQMLLSMLKSAQKEKRSIRVTRSDAETRGITTTVISSPSLVFEREWKLRDSEDRLSEAVALSQITNIEFP